MSGEDEKAKWPTCGSGLTKRYVANNDSCTDDYLCPNSMVKFVPLIKLCDKIDTCGNENQVCKISKGAAKLYTKLITQDDIWPNESIISYCFKGLETLKNLIKPLKIIDITLLTHMTFNLVFVRA